MEHCNLTARILANEDVINPQIFYEMIVSIENVLKRNLHSVAIKHNIDKKLSVIRIEVKW